MLAFKDVGRGAPVVLIHAFPLSSKMWARLKSLEGVRLITPDLPGFAGSERQAKPSIPEMAKEIARLLDSLKLAEPVILGGLSMGGYVAFEFLRQFPGRVRGLGLFSTRAAADTPEARQKRMKTIELIQAEGVEAFAEKTLPNLVGKTSRETRPEVVGEVTQMILANRAEAIIDALRAMAERRDSADLLGSIRIPTLVVAGEEDTFVPLSEARAMQEKIPGSKFRVQSKAKHLRSRLTPYLKTGSM